MAGTIERDLVIKPEVTNAVRGVQAVDASLKKTESTAKSVTQTTSKLGDALADVERRNKLDNIAKSAAKYAAETGNARTAQLKLNAALEKFGASDSEVKRVASAYDRNLKKAIQDTTREIERQEKAAERASSATQKAADRAGEKQRFDREEVGDVSTSLGSVASVLNVGGQNAFGEAFAFGGDLAGAAEYAGRFKDALNSAGESLLKNEGVLGKLASVGASTVAPLLGVSGGIGALVAVAGPAVLAIGALIAGFKELERGKAIAEAAFGALEAERRAKEEANELTSEEAQERLEQAKRTAEQQRQIIKENDAILNQSYQEAQRGIPIFGDAATRLFEATGGFDGVKKSTEAARDELAQAEADILVFTAALQDGTTATNDAAKSEEDLAKKRTDSIAKTDAALVQTAERVSQSISALTAQADELQKSYNANSIERILGRANQDTRDQFDRNRAQAREDEDLKRLLEDQADVHRDNLEAIEARGNKQIEDLRTQAIERSNQAFKQIGDIETQFRKDELKAERQFTKERQRETERYRLERKRALEDQEADELNSIIENDITSLITDRSSFELERRRAKDDRKLERREAREDFNDERDAAREAKDERIAGIQEELEAFKASTTEKITQIEAQKTADLEAAETAFDEKQRKDQELRDIVNQREDEDLDLKLTRLKQDRDAEDIKLKASLDASLAAIDAKKTAETDALETARLKVLEVRGLDSQLLDTIKVKGLEVLTFLSSFTAAGGTGTIPTQTPWKGKPLADGGIIRRGRTGLGYFEGLDDEAVIPLRDPRARQMLGRVGGDGMPSVQVNINGLSVGELVTPAQLSEAENRITVLVTNGVIDGIKQAREQRAAPV